MKKDEAESFVVACVTLFARYICSVPSHSRPIRQFPPVC